jgi:uncharacterized membrane protein YccC
MIEDTIAELEARLQKAESVNPESKAELLRIITLLKAEAADLADTREEGVPEALAAACADEELRAQRRAELSTLSLDEISTSVTRFEKTHPQLVQVVNRICQTLSNLGI